MTPKYPGGQFIIMINISEPRASDTERLFMNLRHVTQKTDVEISVVVIPKEGLASTSPTKPSFLAAYAFSWN